MRTLYICNTCPPHPFIRDPRSPETDECRSCGIGKAEPEHVGQGELWDQIEDDE